jgi:hypothetical protein
MHHTLHSQVWAVQWCFLRSSNMWPLRDSWFRWPCWQGHLDLRSMSNTKRQIHKHSQVMKYRYHSHLELYCDFLTHPVVESALCFTVRKLLETDLLWDSEVIMRHENLMIQAITLESTHARNRAPVSASEPFWRNTLSTNISVLRQLCDHWEQSTRRKWFPPITQSTEWGEHGWGLLKLGAKIIECQWLKGWIMEQVLSLFAQAAVALYRKPRRPEWECFGSKPIIRNFSKLAQTVEQGQYY